MNWFPYVPKQGSTINRNNDYETKQKYIKTKIFVRIKKGQKKRKKTLKVFS